VRKREFKRRGEAFPGRRAYPSVRGGESRIIKKRKGLEPVLPKKGGKKGNFIGRKKKVILFCRSQNDGEKEKKIKKQLWMKWKEKGFTFDRTSKGHGREGKQTKRGESFSSGSHTCWGDKRGPRRKRGERGGLLSRKGKENSLFIKRGEESNSPSSRPKE